MPYYTNTRTHAYAHTVKFAQDCNKCSFLIVNPITTHTFKDRTHDATLRATLRAMGWTHGAIVAWNVAEVELASTPATLRAILHAMLHRVSGPLHHTHAHTLRTHTRTHVDTTTTVSLNVSLTYRCPLAFLLLQKFHSAMVSSLASGFLEMLFTRYVKFNRESVAFAVLCWLDQSLQPVTVMLFVLMTIWISIGSQCCMIVFIHSWFC